MSFNWKTYKLDEIAEILNHKRIPLNSRDRSQKQGDIPYYGASGIVDYVDDFIFEGEHVLISEDGENLRSRNTPIAFKANGKFWVNNHAHILKGKEPFLNDWIIYYFKDLDLNPYISGAVQPKLNKQSLLSIPIRIPVFKKAKRIASILGALDDKIELNLEMNKTLEEMAMALYKHWFENETNNVIESRPLEEILDFIVDNRGKTAPTASEGIPLIATNCVKNDRIFPTYEKVRYIDQETYANWFRSHPIPGDILFVNKGAPGSVNLVPDPIDFCIAQDMIALRVNNRFVSNYYLFSYFRSAVVQNDILNMSVGTTIPHLKKTDLLKFTIPIPKSQYLEKYTEKVSPIFEMLNLNQKENQTLSKTRDTLLPKLISGEIEVKEAEEEVSRVV